MSTFKNIALTDFIDVLNEKALQVSKYEGFYPARFLITDNKANEMTVKIEPTTGEVNGSSFEITISKLSPYDKNWFVHASEAQIAVYQSIIDVLKDLNKNNKYYASQEDGKLAFVNKKAKNNNIINQEIGLAQLTTYQTLAKFRNYSIADMVKPKKEETIASIKDKTNQLVNVVRDSIARLRFIDDTPNFNMIATIKEDSIEMNVSLNNEKILSFKNDWKTIDEEMAYNRLVSLCNVSKAISNTLEFYQAMLGISEPKLFTSKMLSKKWKVTNAGQQYITCLEIVNLIKQIFGFQQEK